MANYDFNRRTSKIAAKLTTTERNALTGLVGGEIIYNSTTDTYEMYNGGVWVQHFQLNDKTTQTATGNLTINIADTTNVDALTIVQNDSTNSKKGIVVSGSSSGNMLDVTGSSSLDGATVINNSAAAVDFTVKSDNNAGMFFVDGSADRVGIGTATPANPLELSLGGQNWGFSNRSNALTLQGQTSGQTAILEMYSEDGDNTDNVGYIAYNLGAPTDISNSESLNLQAKTTQSELYTASTGSGTLRPLVLYTGSNTDQLKLNTDASVLLSVGGQGYLFKDRSDALTLQSQTSATASTLELYNADGDGTDNSEISIFDVGTPADITNRERIQIYKNATAGYVQTEADGTGTLRPLILLTEGNTDQLKLNTDSSITMSYGGQSYIFKDRSNSLTLQSQTSSTANIVELFNKDGDGTDSTELSLFDVGTPADITNRERLQIYKNSTAGYISTEADGTGTLRPLIIYTEGNTNQLHLDTGGRVGIGLTPTANMSGLSIESGVVTIKETTTPTADSGYGKLYTKSDDKMYFQDGNGTEKELLAALKITDTVNNETKVIDSVSDSPDDAYKYDYYISDGTNMRVGTLFILWDGSVDGIVISDVSSADIGDTDDFIWTAEINADTVQLKATATNNYSILKLNKFLF